MVRTNFSGHEIASVLHDFGYERVGREGSHLKMRYSCCEAKAHGFSRGMKPTTGNQSTLGSRRGFPTA